MKPDEPTVLADDGDGTHPPRVTQLDVGPKVVQEGDGVVVERPVPPPTYRTERMSRPFVLKFGEHTLGELLSEVVHLADHPSSSGT